MRTIYNRIESTYMYKRKNNIAPGKASHKHRFFEWKPFETVFLFFFVMIIFLTVVEIDFYSTVSIYPEKKLIVNEIN